MAVAICSAGVPLPARSERKVGADPFPCQHCACGCKDAETCWRDCCCFTNQQKIAWARRNRVTPPALVVAAAKREACSAGKKSLACCKSKGLAVAQAAVKPACCARRDASCASTSCDAPTPQRRPSSQPILLISKLRCGGISLSVSMLPPSVVVKATAFALVAPEQFRFCSRVDLLYEPPYLAVAAPPPDAACV